MRCRCIGPCVLDPEPEASPEWLESIDRPVVLVTTSSEEQADANLVTTAIAALADEPLHVVATMPAGQPDLVTASPRATVCRFVPHGLVLDRAVCAVTHGGMGATQKALARGVPVCVVRPIRGRAACRGRPVRHASAGQETVTAATGRESARSHDNDGRCKASSRGLRSHWWSGSRRRSL